jgi:uncharacterized repeat protein (TIGR03803 family)
MNILKSILTGALFSLLGAAAGAQTAQFTTLTNLNGTNGFFPYAALTLDTAGNLFGSSYEGGSNNFGAVIEVTPNGTVIPFYSFAAGVSDGLRFTNSTGGFPYGGLILAHDGGLYGPANSGGTNGTGLIFKITTNGLVLPFFTFNTTAANAAGAQTNYSGTTPEGKLALGADGNFYGTGYQGGLYGRGNVFKLTTNGMLTKLADFNGTNGSSPEAGLTAGNDGNFYGVTYSGGTNGNGTIFKVTTNGNFTSLYSFSTGAVTASFSYTNAEGANPAAALTLGPDSLLYGTTHSGGPNGYGTIFKVTTNGVLTTLAVFNNTNGALPLSELIPASDGSFYGTCPGGGTNKAGAIFKLTTNGTLTLLYSFEPSVNSGHGLTNYSGTGPYAALAIGSDGAFYGTTTTGGGLGDGTVYKFSIPSSAPVPLNFQLSSTNLILNWSSAAFNLQSATNVNGTYTNVPGAASPFTNPIVGNHRFFRLIGN